MFPSELLVDKKDSCGWTEDFEDRNRSHSFQRSSYSTERTSFSLAREEKPGSCVNLATWGEFVTWQTKAVSLSNHHNNNKMPYIPPLRTTFWGFFNFCELCDSNLLEQISFTINPFKIVRRGEAKHFKNHVNKFKKQQKFFSQYLKQKHPIFLKKYSKRRKKNLFKIFPQFFFCQKWN